MAKLSNFLAIALLALSLSMYLADADGDAQLSKDEQILADFIISPAGENLIRDEIESILISPTAQNLFKDADGISPAAVEFVDREMHRIGRCQEQLAAGGLEQCLAAVYGVLEQQDGPAWEDQCCRNIARVEQGCWEVLFPGDRTGRDLLPVLLDYCNAVVQAPAGGPGLSPSA